MVLALDIAPVYLLGEWPDTYQCGHMGYPIRRSLGGGYHQMNVCQIFYLFFRRILGNCPKFQA